MLVFIHGLAFSTLLAYEILQCGCKSLYSCEGVMVLLFTELSCSMRGFVSSRQLLRINTIDCEQNNDCVLNMSISVGFLNGMTVNAMSLVLYGFFVSTHASHVLLILVISSSFTVNCKKSCVWSL